MSNVILKDLTLHGFRGFPQHSLQYAYNHESVEAYKMFIQFNKTVYIAHPVVWLMWLIC